MLGLERLAGDPSILPGETITDLFTLAAFVPVAPVSATATLFRPAPPSDLLPSIPTEPRMDLQTLAATADDSTVRALFSTVGISPTDATVAGFLGAPTADVAAQLSRSYGSPEAQAAIRDMYRRYNINPTEDTVHALALQVDAGTPVSLLESGLRGSQPGTLTGTISPASVRNLAPKADYQPTIQGVPTMGAAVLTPRPPLNTRNLAIAAAVVALLLWVK